MPYDEDASREIFQKTLKLAAKTFLGMRQAYKGIIKAPDHFQVHLVRNRPGKFPKNTLLTILPLRLCVDTARKLSEKYAHTL